MIEDHYYKQGGFRGGYLELSCTAMMIAAARRRMSLAALAALVLLMCVDPSSVFATAKGTTKRSVSRNSAMHKKKASSKKGSSGKKRPSSSSKKNAAARRYEEDEDEDEEDAYYGGSSSVQPYYSPRRKPSGPTVWQRGMVMAQSAATQAISTGKRAAERAKVLGAEAAVKAQEASRLAKAYYSSEYEKFLLTATWPSDQRIPPHLTKRLVESVARFPARPHALPEDDPYRVTLRKLWKKMVEKDWRTSLKALYLVHALSRQTPVKNSRALSRTLKSMLGDADPKTGRKYFNRRDLVIQKRDEDKARIVDAYNGFVLRRALLFAGKFEDATPPKRKGGEVCDSPRQTVSDASKRAGNALLVLEHAAQFVELAARPKRAAETHLVLVGCLEMVVADMADAWTLATRTLTPLATVNVTTMDAADIGRAAATDALRALEKYKELQPKLYKMTKAAIKTLRFFDLKLTADHLKPSLSEDDLDRAIAAWAAIADAAPAEADDRPAPRVQDDDDDDDEDDEEQIEGEEDDEGLDDDEDDDEDDDDLGDFDDDDDDDDEEED